MQRALYCKIDCSAPLQAGTAWSSAPLRADPKDPGCEGAKHAANGRPHVCRESLLILIVCLKKKNEEQERAATVAGRRHSRAAVHDAGGAGLRVAEHADWPRPPQRPRTTAEGRKVYDDEFKDAPLLMDTRTTTAQQQAGAAWPPAAPERPPANGPSNSARSYWFEQRFLITSAGRPKTLIHFKTKNATP